MAAPSKNYTSIPDGSVDADSPLDATLMTSMRDNFVHLMEWLGKNYTAAVDHDHDGVNSKYTVSKQAIPLRVPLQSVAAGGWQTLYRAYLYVPQGVNTLNIRMRLYTSTPTPSYGKCRVTAVGGATDTSDVHSAAGASNWEDADVTITLSAGNKGVFVRLDFEAYIEASQYPTYTVKIHKTSEATDTDGGGFNPDYAPAAYFST